MTDENYEKGKEMGALQAEIKNLRIDIAKTHEHFEEILERMDERLTLAEKWIQTTTGKVIVLTTIFGVVGSLCYMIINWLMSKYFQ